MTQLMKTEMPNLPSDKKKIVKIIQKKSILLKKKSKIDKTRVLKMEGHDLRVLGLEDDENKIEINNNNNVVIDISGDEGIEDGEIEIKDNKKRIGDIKKIFESVILQNLELNKLKEKIGDIGKVLESVISRYSELSYDAVCYHIKNSLDSLWEVVLEDCDSDTGELVGLAYGALETLKNMVGSMNQSQREQNKHSLSRLFLHVTSQNPPLFATKQMKVIETMIKSLESSAQLPSVVDTDKQNNNENNNGTPMIMDNTKPETVNVRGKGVLPPLLDVHKNQDEDSLPSPTRHAPLIMPGGNATNVVSGVDRQGWPAPLAAKAKDALKAVFTCQQNFSQSADHIASMKPSTKCRPKQGCAKKQNFKTDSGGGTGSEKQKHTNESVSVGPKLKKQKIGPTGFGTVAHSSATRNSLTNKPTKGVEQLTGTNTNNIFSSLESIVKDMAANPEIWINLVKMELQKSVADPVKKRAHESSSNSVLGANQTENVTLTKHSMVEERSVGILKIPQATSTNRLEKIRLKHWDPRRALQSSGVQKVGNGDTNHAEKCYPSSSSSQEMIFCLNTCNKPSGRISPLEILAAPDSLKFVKNLRSSSDIMSVSQVPTVSHANPEVLAPQPVKNKSEIISSSKEVRVGPSRSHNAWGEVEHLFEGFDEKKKAAYRKERGRRIYEQNKMVAARKLCLVLDLDHTLLNSAKFVDVDPVHDKILRKKEVQDRKKPRRHLFRLSHIGMWTKLRPGIWNFLKKASRLFELHVYTMGNKSYATEMVKLLDPKGTLFSGRVMSRGDSEEDGDVSKCKDLDGVLGLESGVVIIDDSIQVWPQNKLNLIVVERYMYFPCSRRQFGLVGPSLLEINHDERPKTGALASSLAVIERIHQNFFAHRSLNEADVRNILASEQRKVLGGCRIVFSRVIPLEDANPHLHPLWKTAEQFGATCTNHIDEQVTHVVANAPGTSKVNWALSTGRFVVRPGWVEASALLYQKANEQAFAIKP